MGTASLVVRGIVFLIGVPFLLAGLGFLLLSGAVVWEEYQATQGIASTEGTIQSSSLEEATTTEGTTTETVYYPRVQYTYEVDGRAYDGPWIYSPEDRSSTSELEGKEYDDVSKAQSDVRQYRPGETVTVYYYEDTPEEPFLERPTIDWGGAIVFAVFFAGIPLAIGVTLSGGALLFGRIRDRLGGSRTDGRSGEAGTDGDVHDATDDGWEDDDGWGVDDGGGGWGVDDGGGGWGGDGGGGSGGE